MSEEMIGFGFQSDTDESLVSKGGFGVFGLNQNARITKFEYNPNAGKDGSPGDALDITVTVKEKEFRSRLFAITKVYDKKNNELTDKSSEEYKKIYNAEFTQMNASVIHVLKALTTEEAIKAVLTAAKPTTFAAWVQALQTVLPAGYQNKPVDVFLQYQWNIKGDNTMTFLELPKNMKGGYWICTAMIGTYQAVTTASGLKYVNENNQEHIFSRDTNFMESNKAIQQKEEDTSSAIESPTGAPVKSGW